jgi:hypothetical protein
MDLNKKLIDQLSDLSRNIKSLTSEVKENKNAISEGNANAQKEPTKEDPGKKEPEEDQNKKFLKSLEGIFKKGVGEITKSIYGESKGILKDVAGAVKGKGLEWIKDQGLESALAAVAPLKDKVIEGVKSNVKIPKGISSLLGKIPKFATGGVMDKTGLALVGEKGPEVVKLDKGDKVVPNDRYEEILKMSLEERQKVDPGEYLKAIKYGESKGKPEMKTVDQTLSPLPKKFLTKDSTLEEAKAKLLEIDPTYYAMFPEDLNPDAEYELKNLKEKRETFTQEDVQKLSQPIKPSDAISPEEKVEKESKRDQRKKEKEEKRKSKEESKKTKDLLNPEKNKIELGEEKEKSSLLDKGKGFLKEKGTFEKGKNLLFTKGKDLLTGKASLKNPASLFGDKSQLMGKGVGAATSLFSNKELRGKTMDKLKGFKKEKKEEEKASITTESPELKKVKTEPKKEEEKKPEEKKPEEKKEIAQTESKTATPEKESPKKEPAKTGTTEKGSSEMGSTDMGDIKSLLGRMVSLLEGPLSIETMDSPFRPDSRRF